MLSRQNFIKAIGVFLISLLFILLGFSFFYIKPLRRYNPLIRTSSCVVLDEEYCNKGKKIYYNNKLIGIGFNIPPSANYYSSIDGQVDVVSMPIGEGHYVRLAVQNTNADYRKRLRIGITGEPKILVENGKSVKKGDLLAQVGLSSIPEWNTDANIILFFFSFDPSLGYYNYNDNLLEEYFPYIK